MWNWLRQLFGKNGRARRDPLEGWDGIHREATPGDRPAYREPGAPPPDYSREDAAYRREQARLARDYLGKIALIHNDDVAGIYDDLEEAILDGYKRFGDVQLMFPQITDPNDPPEWMPLAVPVDPELERNEGKS
jgi:hypothetical protein